jgi:[protein-PII] uridylyltransferase
VINKALTGEDIDFQALIAKRKITRPVYQAYVGERIATRVGFDNDSSDTRTVIEIETEDRIGLLHAMSKRLSELDLDISAAKISTERGAAIDSFYVRERDGTKIVSPERQKAIDEKLLHVIAKLDHR